MQLKPILMQTAQFVHLNSLTTFPISLWPHSQTEKIFAMKRITNIYVISKAQNFQYDNLSTILGNAIKAAKPITKLNHDPSICYNLPRKRTQDDSLQLKDSKFKHNEQI